MKLSYCLLILTVSADLSVGFTLENVAFNRTVAFESFNASLHMVPQALISSPAHHDLIAKEGTSILIECKLNISRYEYILWYNSRGHLLEQEDEGELSCCFLSFSIPLLYKVSENLWDFIIILSSYPPIFTVGDKERAKQSPLPSGMWHVNYSLSSSVLAHPPCYSGTQKKWVCILPDSNWCSIYYCSGLYYIFPNTWIKHNSPRFVPFPSWQLGL